jgi:hypothetical protein
MMPDEVIVVTADPNPICPQASVSENATAFSARLETLESLTQISELRNPGTGAHNQRVGIMAALIAQTLGLSQHEVELIRQAAPLHDIGTVGIPDTILFKPSKLLPEEFEVMKSHVTIGLNLLQQGQSELLRIAKLIVATHHERFDGSGYPSGRKGLRIPLIGQIVAVADVFDALVHDQPYRRAQSPKSAVQLIRDQAGVKFDPQVTEAFFKVIQSQRWLTEQTPQTKPTVLMKGRLGPITIYDLLQSLKQNRQTCKVSVFPGFSHALLLIQHGKLIYATIDTLIGEQAVMALLTKTERSPNAKFVVESWQPDPVRQAVNIHTPTEQLLLSLAVAIDHQTLVLTDRSDF